MAKVTLAQKIVRWTEFANFMSELLEPKFRHGEWCRPDHTCKTSGCVAGWGAMLYSEVIKKWLEEIYTLQRAKVGADRNEVLRTNDSIYAKRLEVGASTWAIEGKKKLCI